MPMVHNPHLIGEGIVNAYVGAVRIHGQNGFIFLATIIMRGVLRTWYGPKL